MVPSSIVIDASGVITGAGPSPLVGIPALFTIGAASASQSTPQVIPLQPAVNQSLSINLSGQSVVLNLYFKEIQVPVAAGIATDPPVYEPVNPLFADVYSGNRLVIGGVLCQDRNRIVRDAYLGFKGDLAFVDTQGIDDPLVGGLGTRWLLTYWSALQ